MGIRRFTRTFVVGLLPVALTASLVIHATPAQAVTPCAPVEVMGQFAALDAFLEQVRDEGHKLSDKAFIKKMDDAVIMRNTLLTLMPDAYGDTWIAWHFVFNDIDKLLYEAFIQAGDGNLGRAKDKLDKALEKTNSIRAKLSENGASDETKAAADKLADKIREMRKDYATGKLDRTDLARVMNRTVGFKYELLDAFPPIYGVSAKKVYMKMVDVAQGLSQAANSAWAGERRDAQRHLKAAIKAKKALEAAFAEASC